MRSFLFVAVTFLATTAISSQARTQNYPWCAYYGDDSGENCGFSTYQQCREALSGNAGSCERNTQYAPGRGSPAPHYRPRRKHSHS
jgi:hypothetical protein